MPNKCTRCGKIHGDDSQFLVSGCDVCGSKFFFYIRQDALEGAEKEIQDLKPKEVDEIERDIRDIIPREIDKDETVVLDLEAIRVIKPGKYKIDVSNLDVFSTDIVRVKELAQGLFSFHPTVPEGIGTIFYIHLFLVCVLLAYFPFSKLMHMAGIFLSPTRNLSNNSRFVRHVNPWNPDVEMHTYEEYEEEFRDKMIEAGLPVEKMPEASGDTEAGPEEEGEKE